MLDITFEETRVYREIKEEAEHKGRQAEAVSLILRILTKRFGSLEDDVQGSVTALSLENLEALSEALLDFNSLSELNAWIDQRTQ